MALIEALQKKDAEDEAHLQAALRAIRAQKQAEADALAAAIRAQEQAEADARAAASGEVPDAASRQPDPEECFDSTPSELPTLDEVSAICQKHIADLNFSNVSNINTPDFVTHSQLWQDLDRHDSNLKSHFLKEIETNNVPINDKLDRLLASIFQTPPSLPSRRNLSEEPEFRGTRVNLNPPLG
jgi:multidrug efflux pump subunit AcrA (membrane-fusion protein)